MTCIYFKSRTKQNNFIEKLVIPFAEMCSERIQCRTVKSTQLSNFCQKSQNLSIHNLFHSHQGLMLTQLKFMPLFFFSPTALQHELARTPEVTDQSSVRLIATGVLTPGCKAYALTTVLSFALNLFTFSRWQYQQLSVHISAFDK